jgi:hypothetical protein
MSGSKQRRRLWEGRIARWRASSASMAGYCRQHELSYAAFVWWRRRLEQAAPATSLTLIPVVAPAPSGGAITVRLADGIGIEVERGFDAGVLSAVVRALRASPAC